MQKCTRASWAPGVWNEALLRAAAAALEERLERSGCRYDKYSVLVSDAPHHTCCSKKHDRVVCVVVALELRIIHLEIAHPKR